MSKSSQDHEEDARNENEMSESTTWYPHLKKGSFIDEERLATAETDVLTNEGDVAQKLNLERLSSLPYPSTTTLTSLQKSSSAISTQEGASDRSLTRGQFERRRKLFLADIALLVKAQDRVTSLRVQAQEKRVALARFRERVTQQYSRIWDALEEHQNREQPLDLDEFAPLRAALEAARNQLGPVEDEFSNMEIQLVSEEGALRRRGERINRQWQTFDDYESDQPLDPIYSENDGSLKGDGAFTEFEFISNSTEQSPPFIAPNDAFERPLGLEDITSNSPPWSSSFLTQQRRSKADLDALVSAAISTHQYSSKMRSGQAFDEEALDLDAPELKTASDHITNFEIPELYVNEAGSTLRF